MKKLLCLLALVGCASDLTPVAAPLGASNDPLIYGADDRREVYQLSGADLALANSTAAVVSAGALSAVAGGYTLDVSQSFQSLYGLCNSEPFRDQPSSADCSAFVVGDDLIATAGHCVNAASCGSTRFVFGFHMIDASTVRAGFPTDDVYACAAVVARAETSTNDFAVVRVDRPIVGHAALPLRRNGAVSLGDGVTLSGHPAGIPLKVAGGASVMANGHPDYFDANVDSYGGNSGSPVVNAQGVVEGILVRGNTDFVSTGKGRKRCTVSNVCNDNGCPGWESVTRSSKFAGFVPEVGCAIDADCTNGTACDGVETCVAGACRPGAAPDCSDAAGVCTDDVCVDLGDDQFACQNPALDCDDGDPCTVDSCDAVDGCQAVPVSCGGGQVCDGGVCVDLPQCAPRKAACSANAECCSGDCNPRKRTCR